MAGQNVKIVQKDSTAFKVTNLISGTKYEILVTAENKQGSSKPVNFSVETFLLPSELIAETKVKKVKSGDDQTTYVVQVTVTCVSILVMAVILLIIFLRLRTRNSMTSPVVSMTLLHKTGRETRTMNLGCDGPLLSMPHNQNRSQVYNNSIYFINCLFGLRKSQNTKFLWSPQIFKPLPKEINVF